MSTVNLKVLDISHHNTIDSDGFQKMYDYGIRGIIHKSSQGTDYGDQKYAERKSMALDAGLLWGAYHFGDNSSVNDQIENFFDCADSDETTLMALDYEPHPTPSKTMTLDQARSFMRAAEAKLGRKLVLYSGNLIKEKLGNTPDEYLGSCRLWLAQYGPVPKVPAAWAGPWLWQFSGDGVNTHSLVVPGIHGLIDMNSFEGSDEVLASQWA